MAWFSPQDLQTLQALGPLVTAVAVGVAAVGIFQAQKSSRLQRTSALLNDLAKGGEDDKQRTAMFEKFPRRWDTPIDKPMTKEEAQVLFDIGRCPEKDPVLYETWNAARKHLNELEPMAFAYLHGLVDKQIIAASVHAPLGRSAKYFDALITKFRDVYGPGHTWQVIPKAVAEMKRRGYYSEQTSE